MTDNFFSAVLTLGLMAAGTLAVGSEMAGHRHDPAAAPIAQASLAPVTVIGHRVTTVAMDRVTLPMVTVTGRRDALVAADSHETAAQVE